MVNINNYIDGSFARLNYKNNINEILISLINDKMIIIKIIVLNLA